MVENDKRLVVIEKLRGVIDNMRAFCDVEHFIYVNSCIRRTDGGMRSLIDYCGDWYEDIVIKKNRVGGKYFYHYDYENINFNLMDYFGISSCLVDTLFFGYILYYERGILIYNQDYMGLNDVIYIWERVVYLLERKIIDIDYNYSVEDFWNKNKEEIYLNLDIYCEEIKGNKGFE